MDEEPDEGSVCNLSGLMRGALADPAATKLAIKPGLREVSSAAGGWECVVGWGWVGADVSSWLACIELKRPTKDTSLQRRGKTGTQMRDRLIFNPPNLGYL